ncbi:hypothetical protein [Mangrovivirga cuniculi]|uniref:Uncharacterized protein n=1 Tax=Mangrovivirga cuniculi TaxID=2715131 RepID=A0A4D7JG55_9BACT|nr:hypothetical protein [Mangrovivirga cuniculi]QCK13647.1 hypothetical protein DCC35_02195 [Mangrovivirga cuniculi]
MRTAVKCFIDNEDEDVPFNFIPQYSLIESLVSNHELIEPLKIVEVPAKKEKWRLLFLKKTNYHQACNIFVDFDLADNSF